MARHKKGHVLLLALVIIAIGALIMGALLVYLNTSLSASENSEERALTYYAADAGFEDGYFFLQQDMDLEGWNEAGDSSWKREQYAINDEIVKDIDVSVDEVAVNQTYKITSTATTHSGESTTIESYVLKSQLNLSAFGADAITSNCSVRVQPFGGQSGDKGEILGDVRYVHDPPSCNLTCPVFDPLCEKMINGTSVPDPPPPGIDWWPEAEELQYVFGYLAKDAYAFTEDTLDVSVHSNIGPLYREGDLNILSTSTVEDVDLFLDGIIYVTGNLKIGKTNQDFTVHLGNQTIFVEGYIEVGGKTTITESGSIIALGDITFQPKMQSGDNDFIFIMSVQGEVKLLPDGDFWGSVAGHDHVQVQPLNIIGHRDPQGVGFVFPGSDPIFDILTYNIIK